MTEHISPIEELKRFQLAAGCNSARFLWWMENDFVPKDPTCKVRSRVSQIIEEQSHDPYLSRIWILREYRIIDFEDMFDDAVHWYERWRDSAAGKLEKIPMWIRKMLGAA